MRRRRTSGPAHAGISALAFLWAVGFAIPALARPPDPRPADAPLARPPAPSPPALVAAPPSSSPTPPPTSLRDGRRAGLIKLAAPGFTAVNVTEREAEFFSDFFAQQLVQRGAATVTTKSEITALIGLERQKQLLGCADEASSCMAELAGALGVDGIITGTVAKLGRDFAVTIKIISQQSGAELASHSGQFADEPGVLAWLQDVSDDVAFKLTGRRSARATKRLAKNGAILGGALLALGGVGYGYGYSNYNRVKSVDPTIASEADMRSMASQARVFTPLGVAVAAAGAGLLAASGAVAFFTGEPETPSAAAWVPGTSGGALVVAGSF